MCGLRRLYGKMPQKVNYYTLIGERLKIEILIYVFGPIPTWEGPMRERHGYKYENR